MQFRNLVIEIVGRGDANVANLLFEIRATSRSGLKEKKNEIIKTLEKCLYDLQSAVRES
ncbi:hypothetical protein MBGDN05_00509 [Thermoplasmatales archaeon SCGC AB-539-N05]|nr:hypothetical protein MBGDN05_00509 [Thermoplasmatales archaeon SCGC AB-539-N05]